MTMSQSFKFLTSTCLLLVALHSASAFGHCPAQLAELLAQKQGKFEVYHGDAVHPSQLPFAVPPNSVVYKLGEAGSFGADGHVYRVYLPGGESKIYKKYTSRQQALDDKRGMDILFRISQKPDYEGFQVARVISLNDKLMILEDVQGQDVETIRRPGKRIWLDNKDDFRRMPVPWEVQAQIKRQYDHHLNATYKALSQEYSPLPGWHNDLFNFTDLRGDLLMYILKPGNIIVQPSGVMTVIDPY